MGKNRPPLGQSVPPPAPNPPRPARGKKAAAIRTFQAAHLALFGTPSGTITWNITVSKNPRRWFYQAAQTPGEEYHKHRDEYADLYHKTNLAVTACIGPESVADELEWERTQPWQDAIQHSEHIMIALGAVAITPPHPADRAWRVHAIRQDRHDPSYCGKTHFHTALTLGATAFLTQRPGKLAGDALIEHIRQLSIQRMHR